MTDKKKAVSAVGPIWEGIYSEGKALNRYPFDQVVSFIYRNYSRAKPRAETKILEIGCGAGNNLWFAAREGFTVAGVDCSPSAIEYARQRFAEEGLQGDLRVADFINLPFPDNTFDFVIDREALTCSRTTAARQTIAEVRRVLIPEGKFFFNPYSDHHSSYVSGRPGEDGLTVDISAGTLVGIGPLRFYGKREILEMFGEGWQVVSMRHVEYLEELEPLYNCHAEWIVIAQKVVKVLQGVKD
jgi:ubiquinone/menaquinone biosynthesis C-methylase UbiE